MGFGHGGFVLVIINRSSGVSPNFHQAGLLEPEHKLPQPNRSPARRPIDLDKGFYLLSGGQKAELLQQRGQRLIER